MESRDSVDDMDLRQLFFNNMLLLGLDTVSLEAENHIPFNKAMFNLPNKKGAEIIFHFLFQRLNPALCADMFRNCWPVLDKKKEQEFRKTCHNWLSSIAQEESDCHLPRINASLFMSPGGDKFCQLLFYFSGYVLQKVLNAELGNKSVEQLKYPKLSSQNLSLAEVIQKDLMCSSIRHRQQYFNTIQHTIKAKKTWKKAADGYVREYRKISKDVRELDYKQRAEQQRAFEAAQARGSPVKRKDRVDELDPDFDPRTIKRAQRIQQVRDMWQQLDGFEQNLASEREIVESIVEKTVNKYVLDAADISVKVPDMLLRECEAEIRRRNIDNTYQGGRLNLVSVLQLWNLSLHLYLEKLKNVGVPKFEEEVKELSSQVHVQQTFQHKTQALRRQMEEGVPVLKENIEKLRERLDSEFFKEATPTSIRSTSIGLSLMDPSPEVRFSPKSGTTPAVHDMTGSPGSAVDTPEAAGRITSEVLSTVRQPPRQLFSIDLLTKDNKQQKKPSSIPGSRQSSRPSSARSTASSRGGKKSSVKSSPRSVKSGRSGKREEEEFSPLPSPRTMVESLDASRQSGRLSARSDKSSSSDKTLTPRSGRSLSQRSQGSGELHTSKGQGDFSAGSLLEDQMAQRIGHSAGSSPRSDRYRGQGDIMSPRSDRIIQGRRTPTDYLVEEILGEEKIPSPFNSGLEAFEDRTLVRRTPDLEQNELSGDANLVQTSNNNNSAFGGDDGDVASDDDAAAENEEDKENQAPLNFGDDRSVEIEEVLGPELEGEYDNEMDDNFSDTSQRSQEQIIVIDRSIIHQSPKASPKPSRSVQDNYDLDSYHETVDLLEEEQFPSIEDSPQRSIVIDRSYPQHSTTPRAGHQPPTAGLYSPGHQLSASFQGQASPAANEEQRGSASLMSRSLMFEKSPLSDEIRRMFKEALSDTTPQKPVLSSRVEDVRGLRTGSLLEQDWRDGDTEEAELVSRKTDLDSDSELEMPNMDPESRTSDMARQSAAHLVNHEPPASGENIWDDQVENIVDIEMPCLDNLLGQDGDEGDSDWKQLLATPDAIELMKEGSSSPNMFRPDDNVSPPALSSRLSLHADEASAALDEFFASKTPEMPKLKKLQGAFIKDRTSPTSERSPSSNKSKPDITGLLLEQEVGLEMFSPPKFQDEDNAQLKNTVFRNVDKI